MVKLRIEVDRHLNGDREIAVKDKDGKGKKNRDVEVEPKGSIRWRADKSDEVFHVFFFEDQNKTNVIWPFELTGANAAPPDGHDGLGRPYLKVVDHPAKVRWLAELPFPRVKYDVVKEPKDNVPVLDPVIIIKPPTSRNLRFALICALAGAVAGAIVGALLASRPG